MKKRRKHVNYKEYMQSPEWKAKSERFISQVGSCERCGSIHNLGAHHRTYDNLGSEVRRDILILCWRCHMKYHKKLDKRIKKVFRGITSREAQLIGKRQGDGVIGKDLEPTYTSDKIMKMDKKMFKYRRSRALMEEQKKVKEEKKRKNEELMESYKKKSK